MNFEDMDKRKEIIIDLISNAISPDIPELYNLMEIVDIDAIISLFDQLSTSEKPKIYECYKDSNLIEKVHSGKHSPHYIHGDGMEPIIYIDFKDNDHPREMGIPNIIYYISFIYNTINIYEKFLKTIYSDASFCEKSLSPILISYEKESVIETRINTYGYSENVSIEVFGELTPSIVENLSLDSENKLLLNHNRKEKAIANKLFSRNLKKIYSEEGTNSFVLEADIESFYDNIYTHLIERMAGKKFIQELDNYKIIKEYLQFLDKYNQKVNCNETKGILIGPISSFITSELLLMSIDYELNKFIEDRKLSISYLRYVDDFKFYSNQEFELYNIYDELQKILFDYKLRLKDTKKKLHKDLYHTKSGRIQEIIQRFHFLDTTPNKSYSVKYDDILHLRSYINELLDKNDTTQIKLFLSLFENKLKNSKDNFDIVFEALELFIYTILKTGYIKKRLFPKIYKCIEAILKLDETRYNEKIWNILNSERDNIDNKYSNTTIQLWNYYLLYKYSLSPNETKELFDYILNLENPLLTILLIEKKQKSKSNGKIIKHLVDNNFFMDKKDKSFIMGSQWGYFIIYLYSQDNYNHYRYMPSKNDFYQVATSILKNTKN